MPGRIYDMTDGLIYTITDTTDLQKMFLLFRIDTVPDKILDCLPEMGKDSSSILNACEGMYLDSLLLSRNPYIDGVAVCDSFAFENKRIAFFYGKEDIEQITKKTFFEKEKYALNLTRRFSLGCNQLLIFTKEEARQVGYDAVIIHRNRRLVSKKEVVKKLRKK